MSGLSRNQYRKSALRLQIAPRSKRASQSAARAPRNAPAPSTSHPYRASHLHRAIHLQRAHRTHTAHRTCSPSTEHSNCSPHRDNGAQFSRSQYCNSTTARFAIKATRPMRTRHTVRAFSCQPAPSPVPSPAREKADREMRSAFGFSVTAVLHVSPCGRALRSAHLMPSLFSARRKRRSYTYTTVSGARRSLSSRGA